MLTQSGHGDYDFETRFNTWVAAGRPAPTWLNFLSNAYATGPAPGLQSHLVEPIRSRQDRSGAYGTGQWDQHKGSQGHGKERCGEGDILQFILIGVFGQVVAQLFITWGVRFSLASKCGPVDACTSGFHCRDGLFFRRRANVGHSLGELRAGYRRRHRMLWCGLEGTRPDQLQVLFGQCHDFPERERQRVLQRLLQKTAGALFAMRVLFYSYYAVFAFLLPITLYSEPGSRASPSRSGSAWLYSLLFNISSRWYCS